MMKQLKERYPLNTFGEYSINRSKLAQSLPIQKANEIRVIIGDTDKDIIAAQDNNYLCLAVNTGFGNIKTMQELNPDLLLNNLNGNAFNKLLNLLKS